MFVPMLTLQLKEGTRMIPDIDQCAYFFKSPKAGGKDVGKTKQSQKSLFSSWPLKVSLRIMAIPGRLSLQGPLAPPAGHSTPLPWCSCAVYLHV